MLPAVFVLRIVMLMWEHEFSSEAADRPQSEQHIAWSIRFHGTNIAIRFCLRICMISEVACVATKHGRHREGTQQFIVWTCTTDVPAC